MNAFKQLLGASGGNPPIGTWSSSERQLVADAVARFGIGRTTIFGLMREGRLTRYKIGTITLIRTVEMRAVIEAGADRGPSVGLVSRRA